MSETLQREYEQEKMCREVTFERLMKAQDKIQSLEAELAECRRERDKARIMKCKWESYALNVTKYQNRSDYTIQEMAKSQKWEYLFEDKTNE